MANVTQIIAMILAVASFLLSLYTLWFTQLRRGRLQMTTPTLIFMGREGQPPQPKIFLRTLLFCTADKGCVVENMHLRVHNEYGAFLFDFWGYGETQLVKGSGLFVPKNGVIFNHHFLLNRKEQNFLFVGGDYRIEVYAKLVGQKSSAKLAELQVSLIGNQSPTMIQIMDAGIFFEWDVDAESYVGHVERRASFAYTSV